MINIFLILFNAIPAFPMDGGRVLRALLTFRMKRSKATNIAARLGQVMGVIFILAGLFGNLLLVLIGVFVMAGAYSENVLVQQQEILKGHKVKEAMMTDFTILKESDTLKTAIDKLLGGSENHFVVTRDNQVSGILTKERLARALHDHDDRELPVSRFAKPEVDSFQADDPLTSVFLKLQRDKQKQRLFPVMEKGTLAGVIDLENLQEFVLVHHD